MNARNLLEATNTNRKAIITFLMGKLFIEASFHRETGKALNRNKYLNCLEDTFKAENNADSKCYGAREREEIRVLAKRSIISVSTNQKKNSKDIPP